VVFVSAARLFSHLHGGTYERQPSTARQTRDFEFSARFGFGFRWGNTEGQAAIQIDSGGFG
jgi:hypothetical protein